VNGAVLLSMMLLDTLVLPLQLLWTCTPAPPLRAPVLDGQTVDRYRSAVGVFTTIGGKLLLLPSIIVEPAPAPWILRRGPDLWPAGCSRQLST